jgi:hypothetical protein
MLQALKNYELAYKRCMSLGTIQTSLKILNLSKHFALVMNMLLDKYLQTLNKAPLLVTN